MKIKSEVNASLEQGSRAEHDLFAHLTVPKKSSHCLVRKLTCTGLIATHLLQRPDGTLDVKVSLCQLGSRSNDVLKCGAVCNLL